MPLIIPCLVCVIYNDQTLFSNIETMANVKGSWSAIDEHNDVNDTQALT